MPRLVTYRILRDGPAAVLAWSVTEIIHHLNITGRQGPSERRSRPRLRERNGARRGSGGKDSPNGAYRSDGPCRHNMSQILVISKVVFDVIKI